MSKHLADCPCVNCTQKLMEDTKPKHTHESGATSSGNYPMYYLLPECFLERTAQRFTYGATRHGARNWEKGLADKNFVLDRLGHALVHLVRAMDNISRDQVSQDDDLGGVACNVAMAMTYEKYQADNKNKKELPVHPPNCKCMECIDV